MKKILITLMTLFLFNNCLSQTFKNYELQRLNSFGIHPEPIELNNSTSYLNLTAILEKERKRRTNKTIGIVLTSVSALTTIHGFRIISSSKNDKEGLGQFIGSVFVATGVIEFGISIPLFISSHKRKKKRDKLIELYKK